MKTLTCAVVMATILAVTGMSTSHAQVRVRADITCTPSAEKLYYDCVIKLANSRTKEPLSGVHLSVGADMPSMPGAHNVRPVKAAEGGQGNLYRARRARDARRLGSPA